jgi:lauroyl/myristoyl acyltransferase
VVTRPLEQLQQVRRAVPPSVVPQVARRRIDKLWQQEAFRSMAEAHMEFLLGCSPRADEALALARPYAEHMLVRSYLRWHPRAITRQEVRGLEWLTTERDPARGVLLSFAHHHRYDGMFGSLARHGIELTSVMAADTLLPDAPIAYRQHKNVCLKGTRLIPNVGGTDALAAQLAPGTILAIASDVPGRTPVTFLGREVLGSSGAPRIATMTDSPVVAVTTQRDDTGRTWLQLHEPLDPRDFADPIDLLKAMLRIHEPPVLAWPEAFESPTVRFGAREA